MKKYLVVLAVMLAVALPIAGAYSACSMHSGDGQGMNNGGCPMKGEMNADCQKEKSATCPMKDKMNADCQKEKSATCPMKDKMKADCQKTDKAGSADKASTGCMMNGGADHKMRKAMHQNSNLAVSQVKKPIGQKRIKSAVCPVMKNKIPDITKAAGKSIYKGKTYYFCCGGCKPMFDSNPAKYTSVKK
ncbi:MAG: YHS domain-containing protein [Armatimonadota bacterium]